jgi:hypothetical protein
LFDEARRQVFDEIEPERGIGAAQLRQNLRQQKRAERRDYSHPQCAAERLAPRPRGLDEISTVIQYAPCALDNFEPERRQYDAALGAVDERGLQDIFQFLMLALNVDWVTWPACAARPKCP